MGWRRADNWKGEPPYWWEDDDEDDSDALVTVYVTPIKEG
jgi:hypothetical protein